MVAAGKVRSKMWVERMDGIIKESACQDLSFNIHAYERAYPYGLANSHSLHRFIESLSGSTVNQFT